MDNNKSKFNAYMKYAGMAFQLLGAAGIGALIGRWVDKKMKNQTPYATAFFAVIFLAAAIYSIIKGILKSERD